MFKYKSKYWSCSDFIDKFRPIKFKKMFSGTFEEWDNWHKNYKSQYPITYWFTERFVHKLQDVIYSPHTLYRNIYNYIYNRYINKTHFLDTKFKPGRYYEVDHRILHGLFETLVDFIEVELASRNYKYFEERGIKPSRRSPEAGLDFIEWEKGLKMDEDCGVHPDNPEYGNLTKQALAAKEKEEIYLWWKHIRPNRKDPYVESGWSEIHNKKDPAFAAAKKEAIDKLTKIEESYENEDTEMLIRLIKIRSTLWT